MSEEYGKEGQNYNFWNDQARMNQDGDDEYREQHTEQVQSQPQEVVSSQGVSQQQEIMSSQEEPQLQETMSLQEISQPLEQTDNMSLYQMQPVSDHVQTGWNADMKDNIASTQNVNTNYSTNEYQDMQAEPQQFSEGKKAKKIKDKKKGNDTKKKIFSLVASAAIFGVVAGGAFEGVQYVGNKIFPNHKTETEKTTINQNSGNKISTTTVSDKGNVTGPTDVSDVVEKTMPSIVSITSKITTNYGYFGTQDSEGSGSGIIINKSDEELLIVTNNHVIDGASTISVKFIDGSTVEAVVKGTSSTADLAVLSVKLKNVKEDTLNKISVIEMGDSENIKVGQMSIAIGNALGYGQSVTVGYISAKDREVEVEKSNTMKLLQTDAAINPGNSGGALLDKDGKLIGINSAKFSDTSVEGMGYAIPVSAATPIINDLMKREVLSEEEKGYLGVTIGEPSEDYNMPEGAFINKVSENGGAKEAGILVGDIITKIDDIEIKSSKALQEKVNSLRVGTKVTVTLMRFTDGTYKEKKVEVTLKGKETLDDLENNDSQSQNSNDNAQQFPNQGNSNGSDNGQSGQQISPNNEDSLEEFFNYYFGE